MKKILGILSTLALIGSCFSYVYAANNDIELTTNKKSPTTSQYINLTIETDDDYTGKLNFSVKYRGSSSSSWASISRTSSTYFSDYSDEWENGYYKMKSSDDGEKTLKNLVKFKKKGYYRIYVKDTDDNESYIQFSVGTSNDNDELELSVSDKEPSTNEWVKLKIKTDEDYTGKISFTKLQYRANSSSSRSSVSMTSNTYVSNYSTYWDNGYYKMTSSDDGEKTISQFIKFKKKGYYRIYAKDTDDNEAYVQIYVGGSSSSSSNDDIELTTNRKSPTTSQYINLTIKTDDDYTGKLNFSVKYRSSSSSSWASISRTSSTYFPDYSDEWENGYYKMKSSDDGEKTLKNLVKFKKKGYYRIYVKDTDDNESYIQFSVGTSNDNEDEELDTEDSNVDGFTKGELNKVKEIYKKWNSMVGEMGRLYPYLKKDYYRTKISSSFHDDMKDIINNKNVRDLEDFDDFAEALNDWYKYTMTSI